MKALVYHGPGEKSWSDMPEPQIKRPTDAIVRIDTTTICGTDLHILKGDVPAVTPGRILGHEGVGTIADVGSDVAQFAVGDKVIISCIKSCGRCSFCQQGIFAHCLGNEGASGIGWVFGHLIDGTQAEYVRVPYAETSLYKVPETVTNAQGVMLSDILPTGFEIGVQYGGVKPGDVVAVVGAGPVGLSVMSTAGLYGASRIIAIDLDANRVEEAKKFGATDGVDPAAANWKDQVLALTDGWAWTSRSRPSESRRRSRCAPRSCGPVGAWRMSACTASRSSCSCRICGSTTSRSRWGSSTPTQRRCSSSWSPAEG
jgi:alcohol dehydrogenase